MGNPSPTNFQPKKTTIDTSILSGMAKNPPNGTQTFVSKSDPTRLTIIG